MIFVKIFFVVGLLSCVNYSTNTKLHEFQKKLKDVTIRFHSLQVDYTEFACLKALVLFKPGKFTSILIRQSEKT